MKLPVFFEEFDQLIETPNSITSLRNLILELAAQGKLVEQSDNDQPASELVERIAEHLQRLREQGMLRYPNLDPLDAASLPRIPSSWQWARLGNVVDYGSAQKIESNYIEPNAWLLDLEDIEKDTSRLLQRKSFSDYPSKSTKTAFLKGDVLYGKLRPYLNKVLVADAPGYCTTEIIPIRTFGLMDPAFLCYVLKRPAFLEYANSKSYGMNLPRLGTDDARRAPIPVPPAAEQRRIAAKTGELLALCDRLEAEQEERESRSGELARASVTRFAESPTLSNLEFMFHASYATSPADIRNTILTLAVRGELVPQNSNEEPAEALLRRIYAERELLISENKARRNTVMDPLEEAEIPFAIPKSWCWRRLGDICFLITDGAHQTPKYEDKGVPFLSVKDVSSGEIDFSNTRFICETAHRELTKRCRPELGDILLTKVGTTGIAVTVDDPREFSIFVSLALLKFSQANLDKNYLKLLINSPFVRKQSADNTQGIGNKNLVLRLINQFLVPIPPLAEQHRIVAKVDQLMALITRLSDLMESSLAVASNLNQAFVNELTAQD
jgi:type I restriction enzyme S subunit